MAPGLPRVLNLPQRAASLVRFAEPYQARFGFVRGTRLAASLLDWRRPKGEIFALRVPGLAAPVYLRAGASDRSVFDQIFIAEELRSVLPERARVIVDAGANIGLTSVYLARKFRDATVVALEVEQGNFELLLRNIAPYRNILPRLNGLWACRARLRITNPNDEPWAFQVVEARENEPSTIDGIGVEDLIEEFGPIDLLKIDIEGGEVDLFTRSGTDWLGKVGTLAVELHDRMRPGCRAALMSASVPFAFEVSQSGEYTILRRKRGAVQA